MNPPRSTVRPDRIDLNYASWHAHLAACAPSRLVVLPRRSVAHTVGSVPVHDRIAVLSIAEWLAHLSGSGQRAA